MTENLNIFENVVPQSGEFFKFKTLGDSIQGTYIGVNEGVDSFGNDQNIYMIQDSEGKIWQVAFRKASTFLIERMNGVSFGQIVGFRFDEERDSKKMPGKKAKIIRIYADNKFVNKEWLDRQKELESYKQTEVSRPVAVQQSTDEQLAEKTAKDAFSLPTDVAPATGALTSSVDNGKNDVIDAVRTLSDAKKITSSDMTKEDAIATIEEFAGCKMTEENMSDIIIKLSSLKNK